MSFRIDRIAELDRERRNWCWCIHAKGLNAWSIHECFIKRVLLLVDEEGSTIEVAFLQGEYPNIPPNPEIGSWYDIREFKLINPTLKERNTHHPYQIKFMHESTMDVIQPLNHKNYFRFEDIDDITRGRVTHPVSFDICGCIVNVDVIRRRYDGRCIEVVFTLLNGRNESVKCRLTDFYAHQFLSDWESKGCHVLHKSEPVFCVFRFFKVGSYEGVPCLLHTEASSKFFIRADFKGLGHHKEISEFAAQNYINNVMGQDGTTIETIAQEAESSGTHTESARTFVRLSAE